MNNHTEMIFPQLSLEKRKKVRIMKKNSDTIPAFLVKTFDILEVRWIQSNQFADIVSWNEDGTAFIVKKVNEFSEHVLPKYFKHSNFASFVRQLNMYDFHKNRIENNENEFKHRLFQRGDRQSLQQIKRKSGDQPSSSDFSHSIVLKNLDHPYASDLSDLVQEMALLSNKQSELEKLMKIIMKQNEKFQKENKYLWSELLKNKEKNESQQDRVFLWLLKSLTQNQNATAQRKTKTNGNNILMLKTTDEMKEESQNEQSDFKDPQQDSLENTLEGLTKKQLLHGLLQAFSFSQKPSRIQNALMPNNLKMQEDEDEDNEDIINEFDLIKNENPPKSRKKVKREKNQVPKLPEQRLMLYEPRQQKFTEIKKEVKQDEVQNFDFQQSNPIGHHSFEYSNDFIRDDFIGEYLTRKDSFNNQFYHCDQNMDNNDI